MMERALEMMDAMIEVRWCKPARARKEWLYLFVDGNPVLELTGFTYERARDMADGIRVPVARAIAKVMEDK